MKIRKATKKNIEKCLFVQELDRDKEWNKNDLNNILKNKKNIFLVAESDNKILGYVIGYTDPCMQKDAIVHEVRVDIRKRRQGIGTRLIEALSLEFFKRDITNVSALIQPQHLDFYVNSCKFKRKLNWIAVSKEK